MYDGLPEDYSEHLQDVGQGLMNGSLDKVGAVIRLVRQGWNHEEAHAAVTEMLEQVETTKKLLRDAARVLDDSPSGQARANARLREAGFSTSDASQLVHQFTHQRHAALGRVRDVLRGIRLGKLRRGQALEQLTDRGMDNALATTIIDVYSDSAMFWAKEWFTLSLALTAGALLTAILILVMMFSELNSWLGVALGIFLIIPLMVLGWSWKNWCFWRDWTQQHQAERECPRSCSPMVMLMAGKGRCATIMTAMEWGLPRDTAHELVRRRSRLNVRAYTWIGMTGIAFVALSVGSTIFGLMNEPGNILSIISIDAVMASVGAFLAYRGIQGWRTFTRP